MSDVVLDLVLAYLAANASVQDGSIVIQQQGYSDMVTPQSRKMSVIAYGDIPSVGIFPIPVYENSF